MEYKAHEGSFHKTKEYITGDGHVMYAEDIVKNIQSLQTELKEAREKGLVDLARIPEVEPENKRHQWGINFKFLIEIGELVEDREMCESVTLEQTEEVILALMKRNVLPKAIAQEEK